MMCCETFTHVVAQSLPSPIGHIEGRIGEDEVGLEVRKSAAMEAALVVPGDLGVNALHSKVHLRQPIGGVIDLLAIDGNVAKAAAMLGNELLRLHEHAARAAAGVLGPPLEGLAHLDQRPHHATRRQKLAAPLALVGCERREAVLIHPAEQIAGPVELIVDANVGEQVDELAQHHLVERRPRLALRQRALELGVGRHVLDGFHGVIDQLTDLGPFRVRLQILLARLRRHPEDVGGELLVGILDVGILVQRQLFALGFERL